MIYFKEENNYRKIKVVANLLEIDPKQLYEILKHLERYNLLVLKKTALGATLIEDKQIKIIAQYEELKPFFNTPSEIIEVLRSSETKEKSIDNFDWANDLKHSIWRRH